MATERKLAAILSADVVGYSRLMAEDDAGTGRDAEEASPWLAQRTQSDPLVSGTAAHSEKFWGTGPRKNSPRRARTRGQPS